MNITIGRTEESNQTIVQPEDGRWQVVVDQDGYPHLYVEVNIAAGPDTGGKPCKAMFCVEDMLPEGAKIRDLMGEGQFEDPVTAPAELAAAQEAYVQNRAETGIPCPHMGPVRKKTVDRFWGDPGGNIRRMEGEQDVIATTTKECSPAEWGAMLAGLNRRK